MQRLNLQQTEIIQFQSQASRVLPGHGTGAQDSATNDDIYHDENSVFKQVFSVLGNVIGGALLLSGMFVLPHLVAGILG
jgi:hypothetical protein